MLLFPEPVANGSDTGGLSAESDSAACVVTTSGRHEYFAIRATVADKAYFLNPHHYPVGIPYVIVNGEVVLDNGKHTNAMPGKVIRGPGYKRR